MAPLIVGNHVIVGVGGDFDNLQGFLSRSTRRRARRNGSGMSTPPRRHSEGHHRRHDMDGGNLRSELNLIYWGTGNPTPVLTGTSRARGQPYTCSIVALNPDTGKLVWAFQPSPHDTHDWDAVEIPVLVDGMFHGKPRKLLMQASRNGYFFVLDRTNGESLLTVPFGPVNWALGVDKEGRPIPNPAKEPAPDGRLIAPDEGGLTNYRSPSFDPKTGLFIVSAHPSYSIYFTKPADGTYGWAGADYGLWGKGCWRPSTTRRARFGGPTTRLRRSGAGVLTTDSGITFTGDAPGNFLALDTSYREDALACRLGIADREFSHDL